MTHLIKNFKNFPSAIPYIIPNTKIPTIDISVIAEYILFLLFCFLLVKPTMAKNIDRNNNINDMKIIKLQTIASHKPITKNVRMRHNKLNKPNFVLFNLVVFIILIFYNTNCLKEWHTTDFFYFNSSNSFIRNENTLFIKAIYTINSSFWRIYSLFSFNPIFPTFNKSILGFDGSNFTVPADSVINLNTLSIEISETFANST